MVKTIPLTQGFVAIVDDEDYDRLVEMGVWFAYYSYDNRRVYAARQSRGKMILMHRVVMNAPKGTDIDHADGVGINNWKSNLRFATDSQNQANVAMWSHNTSGYKGVSWHIRQKKWNARIRIKGTLQYLGSFDDPSEAARAYDIAARDAFGEFARVNFPNELQVPCPSG
jgi:hypothetical protein